jgi:DNA-binding CsgD family transcriptional regulator
VKELVDADSAGFLLPVPDGLALFSEEHDPAELARYPDYPPPPLVCGMSLWQALTEQRVTTLARLYADRYDLYLHSPYYQDYAGANGAHDTLAAALTLGGVDARGMACLHFWHAKPDGKRFGAREEQILRLLYPAFCAGVTSQMQWGQARSALLDTLDRLGHAVLVCDARALPLHATNALTAMLQQDPHGDVVRSEMAAAAGIAAHALRSPDMDGAGAANALLRTVRTDFASYQIRVSTYVGAAQANAPVLLLALERTTPVPRPDAELQAAFGLTRAELRVARLVARGLSNAEIAAELSISPHTARRHTERIFLKLEVQARAEVAGRILR